MGYLVDETRRLRYTLREKTATVLMKQTPNPEAPESWPVFRRDLQHFSGWAQLGARVSRVLGEGCESDMQSTESPFRGTAGGAVFPVTMPGLRGR